VYRKEDLSVYYFIKSVFSSYPLLNVVDSFPSTAVENSELIIPTVSIDAGKLVEEDFEIGNRNKIRVRTWYIDIFAKNKSQRDDMGYSMLAAANNGINIYDYDEGFPPDVSPTRIGHMQILSQSYEPIPVILSENEKSYFRGQIIFVTENDTV